MSEKKIVQRKEFMTKVSLSIFLKNDFSYNVANFQVSDLAIYNYELEFTINEIWQTYSSALCASLSCLIVT